MYVHIIMQKVCTCDLLCIRRGKSGYNVANSISKEISKIINPDLPGIVSTVQTKDWNVSFRAYVTKLLVVK